MKSCKRLVPISGFVAATIVVGAVAGSASAEQAPSALAKPSGSPLSARLQMLAQPSLAAAPAADRARALSLPQNGAGSLLRSGKRLIVVARFENLGPGSTEALKRAGAEIVSVNRSLESATVAVATDDLQALAGVEGVVSVLEELTPIVGNSSAQSAGTAPAPRGGGCGAQTSEGDVQLRANLARGTYGLDGSGIKVGAISDSYDLSTSAVTDAAGDVSSGDLPGAGNPCGHPTPVDVVDDTSFNPAQRSDEGRAQAQIIHDLAPGAELAFATGINGLDGMADNILDLRDAGADVIVDDVHYFADPMFQDGQITNAVNEVVADGVPYFSSAGNNNVLSGGLNVGSFEAAAYRNTSCPAVLAGIGQPNCMNFSRTGTDATYRIRIPAGKTLRLDLQWAQPWFGVTTDLDAYLIRAGAVVADSDDDNVQGTQRPFEFFTYTNSTGVTQHVDLAVARFSGSGGADTGTPRLKFVLFGNGEQTVVPTEYTTTNGTDIVGPTIFGHNGAANTITSAAVPYNNNNVLEASSSRGPAKLYFGPVNGTTPAPPLSQPKTLAKPDVAATDCGANTFFGQLVAGIWRFCGTSAAAPHAAAIAALMLEADPTATVAQIKAGERNTGRPVGSFPASAIGGGLLDAKAAVEFRLPLATINDPPGIVEGDSGNKQLAFTVHLNRPSGTATRVRHTTGGGNATGGTDYVSRTNRVVRIPAGVVNKVIRIPIIGDTVNEPNETFRVTLTKPAASALKLGDAIGIGRILDDD